MAKKKALITGVTGQDGAYLAEFLLDKGYEVHGIKRRTSLFNTERIDHLFQDPHEENLRFILHYGDMTDTSSLTHVVEKVRPELWKAGYCSQWRMGPTNSSGSSLILVYFGTHG